ncbi:MAG: hypothetical protein KAH72_00805 [Flavobacteriaceae bacterium]|nr:hypothetical protein [Flavobacteriaceae bacterium]
MLRKLLKLIIFSKTNFRALIGIVAFLISWLAAMLWTIFDYDTITIPGLILLAWIIAPISGLIFASCVRVSYHIIKFKIRRLKAY